jgi:hypothetical protein
MPDISNHRLQITDRSVKSGNLKLEGRVAEMDCSVFHASVSVYVAPLQGAWLWLQNLDPGWRLRRKRLRLTLGAEGAHDKGPGFTRRIASHPGR